MFSVLIKDRSFSNVIAPPPVEWTVSRLRWAAVGGCIDADITADGSEEALWNITNLLRSPIEVYDERGDLVWWGYIAKVVIQSGAIEYGVDLDYMANRISVTYRDQVSGEEEQTSWAQDDPSVDEYGVKEVVESLRVSHSSLDAAESKRDVILKQRKYPVAEVGSQETDDSSTSARIVCRGWWITLDWQVWEEGSYNVEFVEPTSQEMVDFGGPVHTRVEQSFVTPTEPVTLTKVRVRLRKHGSPVDSVRVAIHELGVGLEPGTQLDSVLIDASDLTNEFEWVTAELSSLPVPATSTYHWIVLSRTGPDSATDYFEVNANNEDQYPAAGMVGDERGTWVTLTGYDMFFQVFGERAVADQISDIVGEAQFITALEDEVQSPVLTPSKADGKSGLRTALEELFDVNLSPGRRMLAEVTPDRVLKVYEEPEPAIDDAFLLKDGSIESKFGVRVPPETGPVGLYVQLKEVTPLIEPGRLIADPGRIFVEESEYNTRRGALRLRPRSIPKQWEQEE